MLRSIIAILTIAATLVGCATTDDSDIPWGGPAQWEGSPFIPGLSE